MERLEAISKQLSANKAAALTNATAFANITLAPPDPILGTALAYRADSSKGKMNLGIGAYRYDNEKPYVFQTVRKVERQIANDLALDKEYSPIEGLAVFCSASQRLLFGETHPKVVGGEIFTTQAISGTGALRVGFEFISRHLPGEVLVSNPTWGNHITIIEESRLKVREYPYFDAKTRGLDFEGMMGSLSRAAPGTIVLLHACAHNPTGVDPTEDQWRAILKVMKERNLFPFLDSAYQGYASGDLDKDAWAVRLFLESGLNFIVAQSFAKNMGLYGERAGALHFVCPNKDTATKVGSQVKLVIRPMYSNPPLHAARLAGFILANAQLREEWKAELREVSQRIIKMRTLLRDELVRLQVPGKWDHIVNQIGMFSYTGLNKAQCEVLIDKWHIYLIKNGRISMAGVTSKNVVYLARAIKDAIESTTK